MTPRRTEVKMADIPKRIFTLGARAYMAGKTQDDNPFDPEIEPTEHEGWRLGFGEESAYWEHQSGIAVNMR